NLTVYPGNNASQTLTVTAYKAGTAVSGSLITINYTPSTPLHGTTLTTADFGSNYDNIDEIQVTTSTGIGISLDNIQTTTAIVLPVTFLYFNGQTDGRKILLNWGTATESNVKNFEIERSVDGSVFLPRGITDSKAIRGNSASTLNYSYTDHLYPASPFSLFYRLRESDLDGRFTYSPVLTIGAPPGSLSLSVYPNPFRQQVTITLESPAADKAVITVTDMAGKRVLEQVSPLQKGSNLLSLSALSQLGKGMYLFTIVTGQQKQAIELVKIE
ncbi:MAG TPA: T9SS type A sorting domain-containing protein, partial [Puia sp.]